MNKILTKAALVLFAFSALAETFPSDTFWTPLSLDTTAQTKELEITYPIPYSAKWAYGDYDRTITITATQVGDTNSTTAASYTILTSSQEETGSYAWNYTLIDPEILPRGVAYTLNYKIFDGDDVFETKISEASVILVPEASTSLLALLLLSLIKRK